MKIFRIVSGGQTGVDRAAWDIAIEKGLKYGGWVPKGRKDENGEIPSKYQFFQESDSSDNKIRTELNVLDSDGTLILAKGKLSGGTKYTAEMALKHNKPVKYVDFTSETKVKDFIATLEWLQANNVETLNVAGPRLTEDPEIYSEAKEFLSNLLGVKFGFNKEIDVTIALSLRDATLNNFRHWDLIRWQVPYWYCTLATVGASLITFFGNPEYAQSIRYSSFALTAFGFLSIVLLYNLIRYDHNTINGFNEKIQKLQIDELRRSVIQIDRPFEFKFPRVLRTASFWFIAYTIGITILFLITFIFGVWWK
ncbi:MAG: putative molybdenum carrier protein, partial [Bacteroidota bacterium]